jgi:hypothetical protein
MGKSGNPAARQITSAADLKKKKGGVFDMPSGAVMRLRNPGGLRVFMSAGEIPNPLMPIIEESIQSGKPADMGTVVKDGKVDAELVRAMQDMMWQCATKTIVEPAVVMPPEKDSDRDESILYADEVDDEDLMFIFQWVSGGTADVARFRSELSEGVASVDGRQAVAVPAKRASRPRKRAGV